ncbi:MAG: hypothetical protein K2P74_04860 [Nitrosomonas sp.]|nr:hypothetical protein [Nitrosomonas sp.]
MTHQTVQEFNSTNDAATRLAGGTYTGTIARDDSEENGNNRIGEFSSTHDAATRLAGGTYTGTIARDNDSDQSKKRTLN